MWALTAAAALGLLLGVRHAFEPDHLAAISALVAERPGKGRGFWLGATWGLGHTLSLLGVGGALCLFRAQLPAKLEDGFELAVALMLVVLGIRALRRAQHGHDHSHVDGVAQARRSLLVGLTHGLAGSGALTALAMAAMPTAATCLAYMGLFGAGSAIGMGAMTALASHGFGAIQGRARMQRGLIAAAGLASLVLGLAWGAQHALHLANA